MVNLNSGGIVLFDFDDILVDFSIIMYRHLRSHWRTYSRWFVDLGEMTTEQVQQRQLYNIPEWLIKRDFTEYSSTEYTGEMIRIFQIIKDNFFTDDLYDDALPNEFAKKTLLNPLYIDDSLTKKVYIITRNATKAQERSKDKFIKKYFNHPKIETIHIMTDGKSKAEVIKERKINFRAFIDDEIPNIRKFAEEFESLEGKEFIIPEYGYNKMPPELRFLIEEKGGMITYYNPFRK